jgi:Dynein light chain type 1
MAEYRQTRRNHDIVASDIKSIEMREDAVEFAQAALRKYNTAVDAANCVGKEMSSLYGGKWVCMVSIQDRPSTQNAHVAGTKYGFALGQVNVLVYQQSKT